MLSYILKVMRECRNSFTERRIEGDYVIENGVLKTEEDLQPGGYILLWGSRGNDGLYLLRDKEYSLDGAQDERFAGRIHVLRVPPDFVTICEEIRDYCASPMGKAGALVSETVLGTHKWSKATGKNGAPLDWQTLFAPQLAPYRRMFSDM